MHALLSPFFWATIQSNLRGAIYKGINLGALREFLIPMPPLAEQAEIVDRVEALMGTCRDLELEIEQSRIHATDILQSVLKEAFAPASQ